jgi:hypothetical protein
MLIPYSEMELLQRDIIKFLDAELAKRNYENLTGLLGLAEFAWDFTYFLEGKLLELKRFLL